MKKLLLSMCLLAVSVQASQDWRLEKDDERAEQLARDYFQHARKNITREDIYHAVKRFPFFLQWQFFGEKKATIAHIVSSFECNRDVLYYLLGFSPDILVKDSAGSRPGDVCPTGELSTIFEQYAGNPWRHPETVFKAPVSHTYIYDKNKFRVKFEHGQDEFFGKTSLLGKIFDKKVLGVLSALILLGLISWYNGSEDIEQVAIAE